MSETITLNGRFLTQNLGGVQRYCREVITAIDACLGDADTALSHCRWVLAIPENTVCDLNLRHIAIRTVGGFAGHLWEQVALARFASNGILVNLGNSTPLLHRASITIVHDALVYRLPHTFSFAYRSVHQTLGRLMAGRTRIGTVSEFSRAELAHILKLPADSIFVAPNSCQHFADVQPDPTTLQRLGIQAGRFFLLVGTPAPNKNIQRAVDAFMQLNAADQRFVLVGGGDPAVYSHVPRADLKNVIFAGRVSDPDLACLYRAATALIFPSLYEGFGIPPLEAMICGCPVIAARIPPVVEVCGDAAWYVDPLSAGSMAASMQAIMDGPAEAAALRARGPERAAMFSWHATAVRIISEVASLAAARAGRHATGRANAVSTGPGLEDVPAVER